MAHPNQGMSALVIDPNPTSRSTLAAMLRDAGATSVAQTSKVLDARRHLEQQSFDVVLCDYHFEGANYTGQDLLDDLRRAQLLPFSTVFIMVTGEASYAKVAEAAESALDGYLLKPHTASALAERVRQARQRKFAMRDIFSAIENGEFELAARRCLMRFAAKERYWLYAARIGAELLLRLQQHDSARKLFEAVSGAQALPWSKLGIARAQIEQGQVAPARRTLEALLAEDPGYTDAYDVMGRVQVEQGELEEALATYRRAAELTPCSIARLQKQGTLAFFMGNTDEAMKALERSAALGAGSKMFDFQSLVMLAFSQFDKRDPTALQRSHERLQQALQKGGGPRLERFVDIAGALRKLLSRQIGAVIDEVRAMTADLRSESFDLEAACNYLALLARLRGSEVQLDAAEGWVTTLAQRFCVSKAATELLTMAASPCPSFAQLIASEQHTVLQKAESAMSYSLAGDPRSAVVALLVEGQQTLNAKLIDTARLVLQRHHGKVADADELSRQIEDLRQRFARQGTQVRLGHPQARAAGGLTLRTREPAPEGEAASATGPEAGNAAPPGDGADAASAVVAGNAPA